MMICIHSLGRAGTYFLSFDKVDVSKGKMGHGCVKIMSRFDGTLISHEYPDEQVLTLVLEADKTGGTSKDVADGMAYLMKKLCLTAIVVGAGATTDSGGGGTIESVARALVAAGILLPPPVLIANCTLHNLNLEMVVPLNKILKGTHFDSSKKTNKVKHDDCNVEQLVFFAYAWEHTVSKHIVHEYWDALMEHTKKLNSFSEDKRNTSDEHYQDVQELIVTWNKPLGKNIIGMKCGCETRWWTLGEAADILCETLPMQISMANVFDKLKQNGKASDTCWTFLSLAKEPSIRCNLALLKCHHSFYMARSLQFFQRADPFTWKGGFGKGIGECPSRRKKSAREENKMILFCWVR
jgi:hypothetical protein